MRLGTLDLFLCYGRLALGCEITTRRNKVLRNFSNEGTVILDLEASKMDIPRDWRSASLIIAPPKWGRGSFPEIPATLK